MLAEHLVYSTAIAIIVGMLFFHYTGRDSSWIVILVSYVPDLDKVLDSVLNRIGFTVMFEGSSIHHGTFHNIAVMVVFALMMGFLLHPFGIRYLDSVLFSIIGFGAHLFEDALVYTSNYMYLWPFSREKIGLGWLPINGYEENYNASFFHIANTEVLFIGFSLLLIAILIRTWFEGTGWIRWYMPVKVYCRYFAKKKIA